MYFCLIQRQYTIMTKLFPIILILFSLSSFAQTEWNDFSGKQKAFFYQLTRKIENINPQVFHLFEFTDSIPYINDTLADYPYVEKQIVTDSSKLILHQSEFSRKNNGIISDIATHYTVWELGLMLQFRASTKSKFTYLKAKIEVFENYVREKAPQSAIRYLSNDSGSYALSPSIQKYYAPNLSINEKIAAIKNSSFSLNDQLLIIRSIYYAQEKYINIRSKEIFEILGGETRYYQNFLIGAGDGDNYSELESILRTKYNRALPDPKTYFRFDTETKLNKATKKQVMYCKRNPIKYINTIENLQTKVHLDVWGYHPERQTTIVIQKGGNSYVLYGNSENRYLTPDSTFGDGSTYWRQIYELENVHISELKDMIYGKRGYDYHISDTEASVQKSLFHIKNSEEKLNKMRYSPIAKPKLKKKKFKKKNLGYSDQSGTGHVKGKMTKDVKNKNKEQSRLVHLNTQLQNQKRLLKQLKADKEKAFTVLAKYETQLDLMKKNIGNSFITFEKSKKGNYLFNDGSTFNYLKQDFTFKPHGKAESFNITTVAFGEKLFSKTSEEVFVHINITHPELDSKHTLYNEILNESELSISDSIQIRELFTALGQSNKPFNVSAIGYGIIKGESHNYTRDSIATVINYNKETESVKTLYTYHVKIEKEIDLKVKTYRQAMLPYQFTEKFGKHYTKAKSKNTQLNEIDFYTTYLAKKRLDLYLNELTNYANKWLIDSDQQPIILKKLKKAKNKIHYSITSSNNIKFPTK